MVLGLENRIGGDTCYYFEQRVDYWLMTENSESTPYGGSMEFGAAATEVREGAALSIVRRLWRRRRVLKGSLNRTDEFRPVIILTLTPT